MRLLFVFLVHACGICVGFRSAYPHHELYESEGEAGDPLFLTKYIEAGKIREGQLAAKVQLPGTEVPSYAGYFTVNKNYNSNLFFWYFPAEVEPEDAPVVVWLQGGPGASSMFGLFCENGPFFIGKDGHLQGRNISWTKAFNMIYIDNPVGTGFSFTDNENGYVRNEESVGRNLYSAIAQYFTLFPQLQKNDFFLTGESYAGKYVPAAAFAIHTNNKNRTLKINLKGLAMGDGWTAPEYMLNYGDYLYQLGLIDSHTRGDFLAIQDDILKYIEQGDYHHANQLMNSLIGDDGSLYYNITGLKTYYNYVFDSSGAFGDYAKFLQSDGVRKSIHVGGLTYNNGYKTGRYLYNDTMQSVKPKIEVLIEEYRILFYNGQLDIICAYPLTVNVLQHLDWSGAALYKTAERKTWLVGGALAGYSKVVKGLTEVVVRDSGHMVPQDQPGWAFDLITRFVFNKPL